MECHGTAGPKLHTGLAPGSGRLGGDTHRRSPVLWREGVQGGEGRKQDAASGQAALPTSLLRPAPCAPLRGPGFRCPGRWPPARWTLPGCPQAACVPSTRSHGFPLRTHRPPCFDIMSTPPLMPFEATPYFSSSVPNL